MGSLVAFLSQIVRRVCWWRSFENWSTGWLKINTPPDVMQFLHNQLPDFENSWSCLILTLLQIKQYARYSHLTLIMQPHYRVKHWLWKSQFSQQDFCLPVKFAKKVFLLMKTTFSWTLMLNIRMIVFGLLARKRCGQKSPGSRKGEICQPRVTISILTADWHELMISVAHYAAIHCPRQRTVEPQMLKH